MDKKNLASVTESFNECVNEKEGITPAMVVAVSAMTFIVGAILGRSLK